MERMFLILAVVTLSAVPRLHAQGTVSFTPGPDSPATRLP
jgi:hypothetical protein